LPCSCTPDEADAFVAATIDAALHGSPIVPRQRADALVAEAADHFVRSLTRRVS
jgi:hypothetical protein